MGGAPIGLSPQHPGGANWSQDEVAPWRPPARPWLPQAGDAIQLGEKDFHTEISQYFPSGAETSPYKWKDCESVGGGVGG